MHEVMLIFTREGEESQNTNDHRKIFRTLQYILSTKLLFFIYPLKNVYTVVV